MNGIQKRWSMEETCRLIQLYKENPVLWDPLDPLYKNKIKRLDALRDLSNAMDTTIEEIERKLKNINSQYCRERRNYKKLKITGNGKPTHAKWFGYDAMSFLHGKNKFRKYNEEGLELEKYESSDSCGSFMDSRLDNHLEKEPEEMNLSIEEIKSEEQDPMNNIIIVQVESESEGSTSKSTNDTSCRFKKETTFSKPPKTTLRKAKCMTGGESLSMVESVYTDKEQTLHLAKDEFSLFGELVALKLRNLRTRYAKSTVQHIFNNILYDAELGKYDCPNGRYPMDTNPASIASCILGDGHSEHSMEHSVYENNN